MQDIFLSTSDLAYIEQIKTARQKRIVIAMLTAYGDDSSDEKGMRTFAVAAIMGRQEEWDAIEPAWIKRTGGKVFHATDCEAGYGEYRGIPKDERLKEYEDLTKLLVQTEMIGAGCAVDIQAYKTLVPDPDENGPYFWCFNVVIATLAQRALAQNPKEIVKIILDRNHVIRYNALQLYDYITQRKDFEYISALEKKVGFIESTIIESMEIQAADLFAHEVMKYLDNRLQPNPHRLDRKSLIALHDTGRFRFGVYDQRSFQIFRESYNRFEERMGGPGVARAHFEEWLRKNHCQKNSQNKMRYLFEMEFKTPPQTYP